MINCCSACVAPHERDGQKAGQSDERMRVVASGRDALFCTDAERAALVLTRLIGRADQPGYSDRRATR